MRSQSLANERKFGLDLDCGLTIDFYVFLRDNSLAMQDEEPTVADET
jgi:hypothetical protein